MAVDEPTDDPRAVDPLLATSAAAPPLARAALPPDAGLLATAAAAPADAGLLATAAAAPGAAGLLATAAAAPGDAALGATQLSQGGGPPVRPSIIATDAVGRAFGRYRIVARLGAGAMGAVYRAADAELGRDVALKLLHEPDPALTDRLVREARAMAQINHPNVVAVYDVGVSPAGVTYIAMELVEGQSLRAWQQAGRTVAEIVAAYVAAGRGLAAAHDAGIIHRDFKPDNVLVGADGRVRVTDFGLAAGRPGGGLAAGRPGGGGAAGRPDDGRAPPRDGAALAGAAPAHSLGDVNLTTSGSVLGTPAYMAPEQFTGGHVDARTDQFNFCVALYEALYGERPFAGATFPELCDNVVEGRLRAAPATARISRALRAIVVRGLAPRPGDRYPSLAQLLVDLAIDRARPLRLGAWAGAALASVLALGLGADWVLRTRLEAEIAQSFSATARQTDRAVRLLAGRFDANSNQAYLLPVMREVSGHYDSADFGLGTATDDAAALAEVHERLVSTDWSLLRASAGREHPSILAVADADARLMYTSAAPDAWRTDLGALPPLRRAREGGRDSTMTLLRYDDPALVAAGLLGPAPPRGVAVVFTRTLRVGGTPRSQLLQIVAARQLLDDIRLDDETRLALVTPDGVADGDVPAGVVAGALGGRAAPDGYQTARLVLRDPLAAAAGGAADAAAGEPIGHLVMARAHAPLLALFPHARGVFATAMLLALAGALAAALRVRQIARARV